MSKFPKMEKNVGSFRKNWEKSKDAFILKLTTIIHL